MSADKECFVGIDTSNYTTSVGLITPDDKVQNGRKLLPVPQGTCGLRQSDALFAHIKQFTEVLSGVDATGCLAVGVSTRPRSVEGSYMPCFLAGKTIAESIGHVLNVPVYSFSHQQGHIAAGLLSCGKTDLLNQPFYAFHLSGGTLEAVLVNGLDNITVVGETLDLTAGQLIDRVGVKMGLSFPAGAKLDELSDGGKTPVKPKICLKGCNCCLSGFENKVAEMLDKGVAHNDIACYVFDVVAETVSGMVDIIRTQNGFYPFLFVGGVVANRTIRQVLQTKKDVFFATPALSCDNAVGIAWLTKNKYYGER